MNPSPHSPALEALLQKLKQAREAKQLSLSDIADATLINVQFLEHLDKGNTTFLPQTYIRAFLREYASVVGLDPDTIMREYDTATGTPSPVVPSQPAAAAETATERTSPFPQRTPQTGTEEAARKFGPMHLAVGAVVVVILVVIMWNILGRSTHPVQEVPFSTVVAENERQAAPAVRDSPATPGPATAAHLDSLVLKARTTDTVWVRMAIDKLPPKEYLIRPNRTVSWKAQDHFTLIAVGNPSAILFTLTNKSLQPMGRKGVTLRNVELNRRTLQQP